MSETAGIMMEADPVNDPGGIMTTQFSDKAINTFRDAERIAIFRDLDVKMKFACYVTGTLTGMMSTLMSGAKTADRDMIVAYVVECIGAARHNAEAKIDDYRRRQGISL